MPAAAQVSSRLPDASVSQASDKTSSNIPSTTIALAESHLVPPRKRFLGTKLSNGSSCSFACEYDCFFDMPNPLLSLPKIVGRICSNKGVATQACQLIATCSSGLELSPSNDGLTQRQSYPGHRRPSPQGYFRIGRSLLHKTHLADQVSRPRSERPGRGAL